jgi:hypothetical protein
VSPSSAACAAPPLDATGVALPLLRLGSSMAGMRSSNCNMPGAAHTHRTHTAGHTEQHTQLGSHEQWGAGINTATALCCLKVHTPCLQQCYWSMHDQERCSAAS